MKDFPLSPIKSCQLHKKQLLEHQNYEWYDHKRDIFVIILARYIHTSVFFWHFFQTQIFTYHHIHSIRSTQGNIYDRLQKREKKYFEITSLCNFEQRTSRAGNSNEDKIQTSTPQLLQSVTLLWIFLLLLFLVQLTERREFQNNFSCSIPYPYHIL